MRSMVLALLVFLQPVYLQSGQDRASKTERSTKLGDKPTTYTTTTVRGRIVWMAAALKRRYGIRTVPEAHDRQLAVETSDDRLVALVEDVRTRAFRRDKRLWKMDLELLIRQHKGASVAQIIRLYCWEDGKRLEVDYWCEICAIPMFEKKACDCCQGPIELRKTPAPPKSRSPVK